MLWRIPRGTVHRQKVFIHRNRHARNLLPKPFKEDIVSTVEQLATGRVVISDKIGVLAAKNLQDQRGQRRKKETVSSLFVATY